VTARAILPTRRESNRIKFEFSGIKYYGTIGYNRDGQICEIFLQAGRIGSGIEAIARDTAVAASLALQFGCPLEVMRNSVTRLDAAPGKLGDPAGPLGKFLDMIATEVVCDASS
jgi:hypothetical protein